jgi:glutaredoxin
MRHENHFEFKRRDNPVRWVFRIFLVLLLLGAAWFYFKQHNSITASRSTPVSESTIAAQDLPTAEVTMYSLSTCPVCAAMRNDLQKADILYTEYFIDKEAYRKVELEHRLSNYKVPGGVVGTPVLFVGKVMYMGRADVNDIRKDMN